MHIPHQKYMKKLVDAMLVAHNQKDSAKFDSLYEEFMQFVDERAEELKDPERFRVR